MHLADRIMQRLAKKAPGIYDDVGKTDTKLYWKNRLKTRDRFRVLGVTIKNSLLSGNLLSLTLLRNPIRMAIYINHCLFGFKTLFGKRGIPQKNVFEVLPSPKLANINLANLDSGETWFTPFGSHTADIISLCLLCQILQPRVVFQIGTWRGYAAFHFALNTPDDSEIFTLDLPDANPGLYWFENSAVAGKITTLSGDSATFDYAPFHGKTDLFFVDGAHSYEYVRSDTLHALKCCHPGSVIAWHDFGRTEPSGVTEWLLEFSKQGNAIYAIPGGSLAFMLVP
jgi:hypothetical protein